MRTLLAIQTKIHKLDIIPKKAGLFSNMSNIVKCKGITGLYSGWLASMINVTPYIALQLSVFDICANNINFQNKNTIKEGITNFMIGALAGFVSTILTYPLDVLRRKMQLRVK